MSKYHKILGINETASDEEIKSAYRSLAKKYHPDVNKESNAENKFKEISEAYDILINKKEQPNSNNDYFDIKDFFDSFPNMSSFRKRDNYSLDVENVITIEFLEACHGVEKLFEYKILETCDVCTEYKNKHKDYNYTFCRSCNGKGVRVQWIGNTNVTTTCGACFGRGKTLNCSSCNNKGYKEKINKINVKIPSGVNSGNILRVIGAGNFDFDKNKRGNLYLKILVGAHNVFKRDNLDIYSTVKVNFLTLLLGDEIEVDTIHGKEKININECTQPNSVKTIFQKGVLNKGNHFIILESEMPKNLDKMQKKILNILKKYNKNKNI